jgi:hypothetical protein
MKFEKKKTKLYQKHWEIIRTKFDIDEWNWEKHINKKIMQNKKKIAIKRIETKSGIKIKWN